MENQVDNTRQLRKLVYLLLALISAATMVGRILTIEKTHRVRKAPFLSANDRSRWCTIRSLVDEGTYAIDDVITLRKIDGRELRDPLWQTIDLVRHEGRDGQYHYYSSKPPLLPTLLAGEYWVIRQLTGMTLTKRADYVGRLMLILTNVGAMLIFFALLARLIERWGQTDWGRIFVMAAATFGTMLSTFAVTLNNHTIAAVAAMGAIYACVRICNDNERRLRYFLIAGLLASFTAANELPALSLLGLLGVGLLWRAPRETMLGFVPGVVIIAGAFFATNKIAHDSLRPPYMHRSDGGEIVAVDLAFASELSEGVLSNALREKMSTAGQELSLEAAVQTGGTDDRWVITDGPDIRFAVVRQGEQLSVRGWDNWYDYEGSYWIGAREGVDAGERSRAVYAFHAIIGHHGIFSLTPIWVLSLVGTGIALSGRRRELRELAVLTTVLTIVCLSFYIARPEIDRNYGGVSCSFRWLLWFTPMWLLLLVPGADFASRNRFCRFVAMALLTVSILSASYASLNPWTHPWLLKYWVYLKWISL